MKKVASE